VRLISRASGTKLGLTCPWNGGCYRDPHGRCGKGKAEEALQRLREIMGKLKLAVNEEKTRKVKSDSCWINELGMR
jgi:hypothetical protein